MNEPLTVCPTCSADRLEWVITVGGLDCYRCLDCGTECSEPERETLNQWADKRAALRLAEDLAYAAKLKREREARITWRESLARRWQA